MSAYLPIIKQWHIAFALLSLSGFILRGILMLRAPQILQRPVFKRLPHVIDSGLFALGITLLWFGPWSLWTSHWLQAKLSALLLYIVLGFVALHRGRFSRQIRLVAWLAAVTVFFYMLAVAHWKQVWFW